MTPPRKHILMITDKLSNRMPSPKATDAWDNLVALKTLAEADGYVLDFVATPRSAPEDDISVSPVAREKGLGYTFNALLEAWQEPAVRDDIALVVFDARTRTMGRLNKPQIFPFKAAIRPLSREIRKNKTPIVLFNTKNLTAKDMEAAWETQQAVHGVAAQGAPYGNNGDPESFWAELKAIVEKSPKSLAVRDPKAKAAGRNPGKNTKNEWEQWWASNITPKTDTPEQPGH